MNTLLTILNSKFIQSSLALRCLSTACEHQGVDVAVAEYTINQNVYDILRRDTLVLTKAAVEALEARLK